MDLYSARSELRNPPGVGWGAILLEAAVVLAAAWGLVLALA